MIRPGQKGRVGRSLKRIPLRPFLFVILITFFDWTIVQLIRQEDFGVGDCL